MGRGKGDGGGRSPVGFPEWAKWCCGQVGQDHTIHMRKVQKGWAHSTLRVQGEGGPPVGPCGQNTSRLRKLPWARGGQKSRRPCSLHVLCSDRRGRGHSPEDSAPCAYRESVGAGAPADSSGSAPSPGPRLHPDRKTAKPAPGRPGTTSRDATAKLQVGLPTPSYPLFPELPPPVQLLSLPVRLVGCREGSLALAGAGRTVCPGGRGQPPPWNPPGSLCCSEAPSARPDSAASRGVPEGVAALRSSLRRHGRAGILTQAGGRAFMSVFSTLGGWRERSQFHVGGKEGKRGLTKQVRRACQHGNLQ